MSKTDCEFLNNICNNLCNNISVDTSEFQNEYNDNVIADIIHKMKELENKITTGKRQLTEMDADYQLRAYKTNLNIVKRNVIECNTQYNHFVVEYYKRVCYLKNNCIRNTDMVLSIYNNTHTKELDTLKAEMNKTYHDYNVLKNEYSILENRLNEKNIEYNQLKANENYNTQQEITLRALEVDLGTKKIRDEHEIKSHKHKINSLETKIEAYMNHNKHFQNKIDILENKIKSYAENEQYYIATYNESRKKINDLEIKLAELEKNNSNQSSIIAELREKLCCETANKLKIINDAQLLLRAEYTWNNDTQRFEVNDFEVV
jgi:chromosome segregation ATPase